MRRPIVRNCLLAAAAILILIQFVPVDRSNPPVQGRIQVAPEVEAVLRRACYDCHSNETAWPWYSRVAPVSWWLADHVKDGREDLNFTAWQGSGSPQQLKKLAKVPKEIAKGKMPPWYYRLAHAGARLTPADVALLDRLAAPAPAAQ